MLDERQNRRMVTSWGIILTVLLGLVVLATITLVRRYERLFAEIQTTQQRLPIPTTVPPYNVVISPNGEHFAYFDKTAPSNGIVIDGIADKTNRIIRCPWWQCSPDQLAGLFFSPNGERLAYATMEKPQAAVSAPQQQISEWAGRQCMVIDRIAGAWYDDIDKPVFSPNSQRYAYVARQGKQWYVVVDGQQGKGYDELGLYPRPHAATDARHRHAMMNITPVFSADSQHIAYAARKADKWIVVHDGREGTPYDIVSDLTFSAAGDHLAYVAKRNHQAYLVYDGQEGPAYDVVGSPVFSSTRQCMAFAAIKAKQSFVILDGKAGKPYAFIGSLTIRFSPDSQRLVYIASPPAQRIALVVCNGVEEKPSYPQAGPFIFSPNSQRLAYPVRLGERQYGVVLDGTLIADARCPIFSPDSAHIAYFIGNDDQRSVGIDRKPAIMSVDGYPFDLHFSAGNHLIISYRQLIGSGVFITVDGHAGEHYKQTISAGPVDRNRPPDYLFFDAPDRFHFFAVKNDGIYRVEVKMPPKVKELNTP